MLAELDHELNGLRILLVELMATFGDFLHFFYHSLFRSSISYTIAFQKYATLSVYDAPHNTP